MADLPDDPSDRPTMMAEYVTKGSQQPVREFGPEATPDDAPAPWYRNRVFLALWALMVALLLTLIGYGIVELSRGGGSSVPAPYTSSTTSPAPHTSSTTSPEPATSTPSTSSEAPPPETPEQTPEEAPPPEHNSPDEPPQHRHHLHVPSTITLPHTVITLPHGF
ncbi:hypothetical protein [Mycobacterium sp.]|uniref:hypothetical protein n=1 Tax=Mycobacterium sp. TaxID=1785 RepID=UPI0031D5E7F9